MYDELIKRLRERVKCDKKLYPQGTPFETLLLDLAADAIEELSIKLHGDEAAIAGMKREIERMVVADKPKWIPVTERLPPAEKEVYVTDGDYIARANLLDEVFPGDKPCWSYSGLGEITHWCERIPLPQPPKEE